MKPKREIAMNTITEHSGQPYPYTPTILKREAQILSGEKIGPAEKPRYNIGDYIEVRESILLWGGVTEVKHWHGYISRINIKTNIKDESLSYNEYHYSVTSNELDEQKSRWIYEGDIVEQGCERVNTPELGRTEYNQRILCDGVLTKKSKLYPAGDNRYYIGAHVIVTLYLSYGGDITVKEHHAHITSVMVDMDDIIKCKSEGRHCYGMWVTPHAYMWIDENNIKGDNNNGKHKNTRKNHINKAEPT